MQYSSITIYYHVIIISSLSFRHTTFFHNYLLWVVHNKIGVNNFKILSWESSFTTITTPLTSIQFSNNIV